MKTRKKAKHVMLRAGDAQVGMKVAYLNDLHLPPIAATIVEAGEVQHGHFQDWQDVTLRVHDYNRLDQETLLQSGSERIFRA